MDKKIIAIFAAVILLLSITGCSDPNEYSLVFVPNGSESLYYIYQNDDYDNNNAYVVYVCGGVVTAKAGDEEEALSKILADGTLTMEKIKASAEKYGEKGDIEVIHYSDSNTKEYVYPTFTLIIFDAPECHDIYFVPSGMHADDVRH